jgi:hypothetical protein
MRPGHARSLFLAVAFLVMSALPSLAARPVATTRALGSAPQPLALGHRTSASTAACVLGITDAPHLSQNYLYPPDDRYYTLLDPSACGCAVGAPVASAARVVLDFAEVFSIPVSVGIVSADLSDPSCPVPVAGDYLCEPVGYTLSPPDAGAWEFEMPLEGECAVTGKAFLVVTFLDLGDNGSVPSLAVDFDLEPCVSYNDWPGGLMTDLYGYLIGNPNMSVVSTCGSVVPTAPRSWGSLKATYR